MTTVTNLTQARVLADIRILGLSVGLTGCDEFRITATLAEIAKLWPDKPRSWQTDKAEELAAYVPKTDRDDAMGNALALRRWLNLMNPAHPYKPRNNAYMHGERLAYLDGYDDGFEGRAFLENFHRHGVLEAPYLEGFTHGEADRPAD